MATAPRQRRTDSIVVRQVKSEFSTYWATAEKSRLPNPGGQRALIASAHKYAACFSYLARAMTTLEESRRIFFQELTSDAVHLVHALVGGDARGGRFYLRSVIENFWRHHYFRDHPVEYEWLHTRDKYFLEMKALREHCGWLTCFQGEMQPLMTNLPRLYAELSTSVHSTSSKTLVLRQTLGDIRLLEEQGKAVSRDLLAVLKTCLALCMFSEKDTYQGLHVSVQEYLMRALSANQQHAVKRALQHAGTPSILDQVDPPDPADPADLADPGEQADPEQQAEPVLVDPTERPPDPSEPDASSGEGERQGQ
jgi:hypothetical protein